MVLKCFWKDSSAYLLWHCLCTLQSEN